MRGHLQARAARSVVLTLCALLTWASSVVATGAAASASPAGLSVTNLQVDYVTDPFGIDDTHPSLSWQLESGLNGERQTAYRILVASAADRLSPGRADVWDSGEVERVHRRAVRRSGVAVDA